MSLFASEVDFYRDAFEVEMTTHLILDESFVRLFYVLWKVGEKCELWGIGG